MSVAPAERVYIDTNIFIKQLYDKEHKHHHKVCAFFKDIQNQQLRGATSSFTKSEYLAIIKEAMASDLSSAPPQKDIDNALKIFDDFIDQMGIEYFELQDLPFIDSTLFSEAQQRIELAVPFKGNDSKWRTLGGADSIVLMLAERCNSDKIATNDDGFRLIASKVKPLLIKDVY